MFQQLNHELEILTNHLLYQGIRPMMYVLLHWRNIKELVQCLGTQKGGALIL